MNRIQDDEIDLFELLQTLWDGKWLISAFVLISFLLGIVFNLAKDKKLEYKSKLLYSVGTIPHFYDKKKALSDFQDRFYSKSVFEDWKKNNGQTRLKFEHIKLTEIIDGSTMLRNKSMQLARLEVEKRIGTYIAANTNQLPILDGLFKYSLFINDILKNEYIVRSKIELKFFETTFKDISTSDAFVIEEFLNVNRFLESVKNGSDIINVQNATNPIRVSAPKPFLILGLSVVLGGIIGALFILVRYKFRKSKEQSGKK